MVKKCYSCGIVKLKSDFHKRTLSDDGLYNQCKVCWKEYFMNNSIKVIQKQKNQYLDNREGIKEYQIKKQDKIMAREKIYSNIRYKSKKNFRLICRTRSRIREALKTKSKSISTEKILGVDNDTYRMRTEYQLTTEMKWSTIEIEHVKPFFGCI